MKMVFYSISHVYVCNFQTVWNIFYLICLFCMAPHIYFPKNSNAIRFDSFDFKCLLCVEIE